MILDMLMQWASDGGNAIMDLLPSWDGTGFDPNKLHDLLRSVMEWNNWLPVTDVIAALVVYLGVYVALQTMGAAYKAADLFIPG